MLFNFFVNSSHIKSFLKNKWLIILLFISVFCIIYIFKKSKCKKEIISNNKNNHKSKSKNSNLISSQWLLKLMAR